MEELVPSEFSFKLKTDGLDNLQKNLKESYEVKVGILENKNARPGSDALHDASKTNAEIGAEHEFGVLSKHLPRRSFLWDMLILKKKELTEEAGKRFKSNIGKPDGMLKSFKQIGFIAEKIVIKAFDSDGYGTWTPLSERRVREKQEQSLSPKILMATTQLSKSITSKVVKRGNS